MKGNDMRGDTADTSGAVAALSAVVNSMEQRSAKIASAIETARLERRRKLDQRVADLLPNISRATLESLKKEAFTFVTGKVKDVFASNRKILGVIKKPGYDQALTLLQTQLKTYLERSRFVATEDAALTKLEADHTALASQQREAMEMLGLLQRAHISSRPMPREAVRSVNEMAQRGRILAQANARPPSVQPKRSQQGTTTPDDPSDDDLWFWMMTDIPTSFRTVMLDQFAEHRFSGGGGTFGGGGAQGAWSSQESQPLNLQEQTDRGPAAANYVAGVVASQLIEDTMSQAAQQPDGQAVSSDNASDQVQRPTQSGPAMATDNSLGAFS
jgi:hypothetical protein